MNLYNDSHQVVAPQFSDILIDTVGIVIGTLVVKLAIISDIREVHLKIKLLIIYDE